MFFSNEFLKLLKFVFFSKESMEVEIPEPLSVALPTPAIPEETEHIEMNQQQPPVEEPQPFITSPLNDRGQMLPPGTPAHKSVDPVNNEDQVVII